MKRKLSIITLSAVFVIFSTTSAFADLLKCVVVEIDEYNITVNCEEDGHKVTVLTLGDKIKILTGKKKKSSN